MWIRNFFGFFMELWSFAGQDNCKDSLNIRRLHRGSCYMHSCQHVLCSRRKYFSIFNFFNNFKGQKYQPHQFGLEGSDWIHNNELLVRLRSSLGLPSKGVLEMSPKIPHWGCSLNVFVILIVFVFVFVVVFLLVRSCFLIALIKCLKGQKSQRLLFEGVL